MTKYHIVLSKLGEEVSRERWINLVNQWYKKEQLSSKEIVERIQELTGVEYSVRQISRLVVKAREKQEAFRLAISKGRVAFSTERYQEVVARRNISVRAKFELLEKAGWKCQECGSDKKLTYTEDSVYCWPCQQRRAIQLSRE